MERRRALAYGLLAAALLTGCTATGSTGESTAPATTAPTEASPTGPQASSTALPSLGSDAESETLCYAEDIQLTRPTNGPLRAKRCIRAGHTITATVFPEPGGRVGMASSSDEKVATVSTSSQADGSAVVVVTTKAPGDAIIRVPLAASVPSGGQTMELTQAPPSWSLTVSVS